MALETFVLQQREIFRAFTSAEDEDWNNNTWDAKDWLKTRGSKSHPFKGVITATF